MKVGDRIELDYNCGDWTAVFVLKDLAKAAAASRESLAFFGDPITRDDDTDESAIKACLQMYGRTMAFHSMAGGVEHVRKKIAEQEGHFPLDGKQGILLEECESWDFMSNWFTAEVKEAGPF